jgi:hypothetical protein
METEVRIMAKVHGLRNSIVNRKKKRKKGWGGNFRDRLDLPKGAATPILLCPGDYEDTDPEAIEENGGEPPHFHYDHRLFHNYKWNEGKKQRFMKDPCTATWQQYRDRQGHNSCIGCHLKKHGDKRVGNSEQYSLNVIHLSMYQKVPLTDREGKTRRFEHDGDHHKRGDPILGWKHITAARDLKEAKANLEDGLDDGTLAMWRKKYIQVGPSHRTQIELIADYAEQFCRCGGELTPSSFFCAGCGDELCDVEDSNMEPEDVQRYAAERQRCDGCGAWEEPAKEYTCNECDDPIALEFYEVVAYVRKTGEGTDTTIDIKKVVPIYDFEFPDGSSLCEWDDDEDDVAFDDDDNFILREDVAKLVNNQFDFDKVHNPRDADLMARLLDVDNPFSGGGARSYAKSRNRFSDDDDGDDETDEKPRGRGRRGRGGRRGRTRA